MTDSLESARAFNRTLAFGQAEDTQFILEQAALDGEGFVPGTGDTIGVIIDPNPKISGENEQPFILALYYESIDCLC